MSDASSDMSISWSDREESPSTLKEQIIQQLTRYNSMDDDEKTKFVYNMIANYALLIEEMYENELRIKALEEQSGKEITNIEIEEFCHRHFLEFSFYSFQDSFLKKMNTDRKYKKEVDKISHQYRSESSQDQI